MLPPTMPTIGVKNNDPAIIWFTDTVAIIPIGNAVADAERVK
jgi:hypothetical protein